MLKLDEILATVHRGCPADHNRIAEATKRISAVAKKLKTQANTELTPSTENIDVLLAEGLNKMRTVLNTIS